MIRLSLLASCLLLAPLACVDIDDITNSDTAFMPDVPPDAPPHGGSCTPAETRECKGTVENAENFCDAMADLATAFELSDEHAFILDQSCVLGRPLCDTCALAQAYCDQDSSAPCTDVNGLCACVGEHFMVP